MNIVSDVININIMRGAASRLRMRVRAYSYNTIICHVICGMSEKLLALYRDPKLRLIILSQSYSVWIL